MDALCPFPIPYPRKLFHLALPESYTFLTNCYSSKQNVSLSSVSLSSKSTEPKEEVLVTPNCTPLFRSTGNNLESQLHLKWGDCVVCVGLSRMGFDAISRQRKSEFS